MSYEVWQKRSNQLCQRLIETSCFKKAQTILAYFPTRFEPDLSSLFKLKEYQWGLPRCQNQSLYWHSWSFESVLEKRAYGILEPHETAPIIPIKKVDLILVPSIACDFKGFRLGYGGGYYDRLFSNPIWSSIPKVGVTFKLVPTLPSEEWDQQLNYICTDKELVASIY
jgi:5-formyltetrahydrofolate cyclo-ligase